MKNVEKHLVNLAEKCAKKDGFDPESHLRELSNLKKAMLTGKYYTGVTHVSRSGMSRTIIIAYLKNNQFHEIYFPGILDLAGCNKNGLISGCGMDMLFAAQYNLFCALHVSYKKRTIKKG